MYEKMGYSYVCYRKVWTAQAGESPAALTEVSAEDFGRLRAEYLPENAVSQTGTNLTFLAGQAKLFRGADFLLAAETKPFRGIELLGNAEAAPGILRALGEKEGIFSTVGNETPFAMYHALQPGPEPTDLGLAFDRAAILSQRAPHRRGHISIPAIGGNFFAFVGNLSAWRCRGGGMPRPPACQI